jgi:hypothetical protein
MRKVTPRKLCETQRITLRDSVVKYFHDEWVSALKFKVDTKIA